MESCGNDLKSLKFQRFLFLRILCGRDAYKGSPAVKTLLHKTRSKSRSGLKKSIIRSEKRGQQRSKDKDIGAKKLEDTREMSKLVKNRGIKRMEKAVEGVKPRTKVLRHAFFRAKTQKDSSPMHKKGFSGRLFEERVKKGKKTEPAEKASEAVSRF